MTPPQPTKPSTTKIQSAFVAHLFGHVTVAPSEEELTRKPLDVSLLSPLPRQVRAYLYTATDPPGERSVGDYKSQLMVPGQGRQMAGTFEHRAGVPTLLIGYAYDFDVWILWDAGLHDPFAFSTNVQVKASFVYDAAAHGIARQSKRLRSKPAETVLLAHSSRLADAIQERLTLTADRLAEGPP